MGLWQKIMTTINLYDNNELFVMIRATFIYYSSNKLTRAYVCVPISLNGYIMLLCDIRYTYNSKDLVNSVMSNAFK